jgi:spoIIIJ-associated protein
MTGKTKLEVIAPSVDEAIARGAAELGVSRDQLDVEVLDEGTRGLLGLGNRQARVRLTLRLSQPSAEPTELVEGEEEEPRETAAQDPLSATRAVVRELLHHMGIRARVETTWGTAEEPDQPRPLLVDVHGDDLSLLIGRKGETLVALQYIVRLIAARRLGDQAPIIIDVQGYRARRERQLRSMARRMAQQATERNRVMSLEPMPPSERRIIHMELRNHPKVYTESVGEGDHRKVTIVPRQ